MSDEIQIRCLETLGDPEIQGLSDVLIDCVEGGASVSFMLPISRARAETFWISVGTSVKHGERIVLVAEDRRLSELPGHDNGLAVVEFILPAGHVVEDEL